MAETIKVIMTGAGGSKEVKIPSSSPRPEWINVINMTDNVLYFTAADAADFTSPFIVFGPYCTLSIPISTDLSPIFRVFFDNPGGTNPLLLKTAQIIFTADTLGFNQNYATAFAFSKGQLGMTVQNTPAVNATITGTADVNILGTPQVDITGQNIIANVSNAGFEADVINAKLSTNDLILLTSNRVVNAVFPNNINTFVPSYSGEVFSQIDDIGIYDGLVIILQSSANIQYQMTSVSLYSLGLANITGLASTDIPFTSNPFKFLTYGGVTTNTCIIFFTANIFNKIGMILKQTTGVQVTDTLTIKCYGIKAGISNPASVPANMIYGQGSYDASNIINVTTPSPGSNTILTAGNYLTQIRLSVQNISTTVASGFAIKLGGSEIWSQSLAIKEAAQVDINFPAGVYNSGLTIQVGSTGGTCITTGFVSTSATTPKSKVATIV